MEKSEYLSKFGEVHNTPGGVLNPFIHIPVRRVYTKDMTPEAAFFYKAEMVLDSYSAISNQIAGIGKEMKTLKDIKKDIETEEKGYGGLFGSLKKRLFPDGYRKLIEEKEEVAECIKEQEETDEIRLNVLEKQLKRMDIIWKKESFEEYPDVDSEPLSEDDSKFCSSLYSLGFGPQASDGFMPF